jgi:2-oxopent-4-enoate hydratase
LSADLHRRLAAELRTATLERTQVTPLSIRHPELTLDDAYAIQHEMRQMALDEGRTLVGHKIGLTSAPIRDMFGIDTPDSGFLVETMVLPDGAVVDTDRLIAPKVEGEIAFRLGRDLAGPDVTREDVLDCVCEVMPVLEVLDSRIRDWAIRLVDTVADNASSAMVVVGPAVAPGSIDLAAEPIVLVVDGDRYDACGVAVMGHPAESVAWLAATLARRGEQLRAGDIVLAGAWTPAVPLEPGSHVRSTFPSLGSVSLTMRGNSSDSSRAAA